MLGHQIRSEDALGNCIVRHFDKLGNLLVECLSEKQADGSFLLLSRREFAYDELGRRVAASANRFDVPPAVTAGRRHGGVTVLDRRRHPRRPLGAAAIDPSGFVGGSLEIGGALANSLTGSTTLITAGRWIGAPGAIISSGAIGVRIGTNLYQNYVDKDMCMDAGSWAERKTGSRVVGGIVAAGAAVHDTIYNAPSAAIDYAEETWTVHLREIDWDRTLKPWKWL